MFRKRIPRTRSQTPSKLPLLVASLFFWLLLGLLVFFVDPASVADFIIPNSYLLFFIVLCMAVFLSLYLVTSSVRRGFFVALFVLSFAILRLWGIGTFFHFTLLLLLFAFLELALAKKV
jgi:hypothetical protein